MAGSLTCRLQKLETTVAIESTKAPELAAEAAAEPALDAANVDAANATFTTKTIVIGNTVSVCYRFFCCASATRA
jgi:hypothetical protein